jgi:hypothetical protein
MYNSGKTLSQIVSKALVGKTILKIDNDESLLGYKIMECEVVIAPICGVKITVAKSRMIFTKTNRILPFDQESKLVLMD